MPALSSRRSISTRLLATASTALTFLTVAAGPATAAPPTVRPGDMVRLAAIEYGCTIGLTGHNRSGHPFAVTAGHCATGSTTAYLGTSLTRIGHVVDVTDVTHLDYTLIRVVGDVADTPISAPGHVGDRVCKTGRMTGTTCGVITAITDTDIVARVKILPGDSGGTLRNATGEAIGITSRLNVSEETAGLPAAARNWSNAIAGPVEVRFPRADRIAARIDYRSH